MAKTVVGIFEEREDAEAAIDSLKTAGFDPSDVSVVMKDPSGKIEKNVESDVASGAVSGATTGAILGGLAGLASAFIIPGIGALFIGGPIVTALGLTGAAAATVSGAATGAVAGGIIGALTKLGFSQEEATYYEGRIRQGAILLAVSALEEEVDDVIRVFNDFNANDIKTINMPGVEKSFSEPDFTTPSSTMFGAKGGRSRQPKRRKRV